MPYTSLPTVVGGTPIESTWGNLVDTNLDDHEARLVAVSPGVWVNLTLNTGWGAQSGYYTPSVRKVTPTRVEMRGALQRTGAALTVSENVFTVPAGYAPAAQVAWTLNTNANIAGGGGGVTVRAMLNTAGVLQIQPLGATINTGIIVGLDSIFWPLTV